MSFLLPTGLWTLLSVPVVVLLHLAARRRRPEAVASLQIWGEVLAELRSAGRHRRFRIDPLLFLEAALAGCLALALAGPRFEAAGSRRPRLALLIDASRSMEATLGGGSTAADEARRVADAVEAAGRPWGAVERLAVAGDPSAALAGRLAAGEGPDRIVVLTDRPAPPGLDGERVVWLRIADGEGDNAGWAAIGTEPAPDGPGRLLAVARSSGRPGDRTARLRRPDGEALAEVAVAFDERGVAEILFEDPGPGDGRLVLDLTGDDALEADDVLTLVRRRPLRVGLHGPGLASVGRALARWGPLGVEAVAAGQAPVDLVFLAGPDPPPAWSSARAVLLPGAAGRGVAFGAVVSTGPIDRTTGDPLLADLPLDRLEVEVHAPRTLPAGTRPLAWTGRTPVLWRTPGGDLVLAFRLDDEEPPEAVPLLLLAIARSVAPEAGRLVAEAAPSPGEIEVAARVAAVALPGPVRVEGPAPVDLSTGLAGLALLLSVAYAFARRPLAVRGGG